ncbi:MAG: Rrf2 family transcriptional regulator [Chloracidobacterium sp.]|uniref:Rrf2 family transcriptional regulator n=1 Tax=Chloracidobacterium validum TaxID=2821543 RepID=A0ABX8BC38_9BACT|nr:Rrf2 family transcriptional regulator [Chloracidobacterium validum]QUW04496.1 Rrf2 family transcriptional regulator [Chloracidobacterium validum]
MRITAQEEYGLRCLIQLARQADGQGLTLKQIGEREGISTANAGKILWLLSNAGIVKSARGIKGGYMLARPATQITVSEVIGVFENADLEEHCKNFSGIQEVCVHNADCGIRPVLQILNETVKQVLSRITLAQLIHHECEVGERLLQLQRTARPTTAAMSA